MLQIGGGIGGIFVQVVHGAVAFDAQCVENSYDFVGYEQFVVQQHQQIVLFVQAAGIQLPAHCQIVQHGLAELAQPDQYDIGILRIHRRCRACQFGQLRRVGKIVKQVESGRHGFFFGETD